MRSLTSRPTPSRWRRMASKQTPRRTSGKNAPRRGGTTIRRMSIKWRRMTIRKILSKWSKTVSRHMPRRRMAIKN